MHHKHTTKASGRDGHNPTAFCHLACLTGQSAGPGDP